MLKRYLSGIPAAVLVTGLLGIGMIKMISVNFEAQDKLETANFEINPQVEEIKILETRRKLDPLMVVEIPPAPTTLDYVDMGKPQPGPIIEDWKIPDMDPLILDKKFVIPVADTNAIPIVRIAGAMPPRATKSGHCKMRFDVSAEGSPYNVVATYCTQKLFERSSVKAAQKFKYRAKILNGQAVSMSGVETTITYRLLDQRGKPIPE